jgi:Flp pilus assembly protein TadG
MRHRRRNERGAVAVEFALLLPLIVAILFGMTEFGVNLSKWEDYESAAREGARYAAVQCQPRQPGDPTSGPCTNSMIARAINQASSSLSLAASNVTVTITHGGAPVASSDCSQYPGDAISVSWVQTFTFDVPLLPIAPRTRTVKGVFRCE